MVGGSSMNAWGIAALVIGVVVVLPLFWVAAFSFVKSGERNVQFVLFLFTIALSTNILPATTLTLTLLAAVVLGFILYMLVCVRRDKLGENSKN